MKWIKYNMEAKQAKYNENIDALEYITIPVEVVRQWSEKAEQEMSGKAYEVFEDDMPEAAAATDERLSELEQALHLLVEGATE